MARARPGLQRAINEILERNGVGGKPLSLRQAERRTGLSPATIGELAKGNARTPETLRRFARGFGENVERLLLLAGFAEAIDAKESLPSSALEAASLPTVSGSTASGSTAMTQGTDPLDAEFRYWLERYGRAMQAAPDDRTRSVLLARLRCDTELVESLLPPAAPDSGRAINSTHGRNDHAARDEHAGNDILPLDDDLEDALNRGSRG